MIIKCHHCGLSLNSASDAYTVVKQYGASPAGVWRLIDSLYFCGNVETPGNCSASRLLLQFATTAAKSPKSGASQTKKGST